MRGVLGNWDSYRDHNSNRLPALWGKELGTEKRATLSDLLMLLIPARSLISRLVETEFYATLSKKKRTKELGSVKITSILKTFAKHIADGTFVLQPMTDQVFSSANAILRDMKSSLRTLDALHLAASKVARCELVTADKILAASAEMYKVPVRLI